MEFVNAAVELVGAALGGDENGGSRPGSVLGRGVVGDHFEFGDSLRQRLGRLGLSGQRAVGHPAGIVDPVQCNSHMFHGQSTRLKTRLHLVPSAGLVALQDSRTQPGQRQHIASVQRQLLDLLFLNDRGHIVGIHIDSGGVGGDLNHVAGSSHRKLEVLLGGLPGIEQQLELLPVKAGHAGAHLVIPGK